MSKQQEDYFDSKSMSSETSMQYSTGDRFKFTGSSGIYSTVMTDIPSSDTTITFNFIACTDGDGNNYPVVQIGNQLWMAENLRTTKYKNGDLIGTTTPATLDINGESSPEYQWAYDGNEINVNTYGRLYTWYAITDSLKICPTGWHVPTDAETTTLSNYLTNNGFGYGGSGSDIAKALAATLFWTTNSTSGTIGNDQTSNNSSCFTGMPGGFRYSYGPFASKGNSSYYWLANDFNTSYAWSLAMRYNESNIEMSSSDNRHGFSVRCLKDNPKNEQAFPGITGTIDSAIIDNDTIIFEVINGEYVFQGDIILTEEQLNGAGISKGAGYSSIARRWPGGIVYYEINDNLPNVSRVTEAISEYETKTNNVIKFIKRTDQFSYVEFVRPKDGLGTEFTALSSNLGMILGKQIIRIGDNARKGEVIHEIGHAIGLIHEHSRKDRDDFIIIHKENIEDFNKNWQQFMKIYNSYNSETFDFNSIMGYDSWSFSKNSEPTMTKLDGSKFFMNREKLSDEDIEMIDILYKTNGLITDIDGNTYNTLKIGDQWWMAENLSTTKFNDNTGIQYVTDSASWVDITAPGYCWYNHNEEAYKNLYGGLYNGYTISTNKICPIGWHVPTDEEVKILEMFLGMSQLEADASYSLRGTDQGDQMKTNWSFEYNPDNGTNSSGFTALPSGMRGGWKFGGFTAIGVQFEMWTSTLNYGKKWGPYNTYGHWTRLFGLGWSGINRRTGAPTSGCSIRCTKD
jgi:uncharacterized protein (TIGR02145 family)